MAVLSEKEMPVVDSSLRGVQESIKSLRLHVELMEEKIGQHKAGQKISVNWGVVTSQEATKVYGEIIRHNAEISGRGTAPKK